jgi:hypothetical protein
LGGRRFHNIEEVEMAVGEGCECKSPLSAAMEFLNSFEGGTNASMCSGIVLKNSDTSLE